MDDTKYNAILLNEIMTVTKKQATVFSCKIVKKKRRRNEHQLNRQEKRIPCHMPRGTLPTCKTSIARFLGFLTEKIIIKILYVQSSNSGQFKAIKISFFFMSKFNFFWKDQKRTKKGFIFFVFLPIRLLNSDALFYSFKSN